MSLSSTPFAAQVIPGSGRGKTLRIPTFNLNLRAIPGDLEEGIYAASVHLGRGEWRNAVVHFGLRPVFHEECSCEVHVIDGKEIPAATEVTVRIVRRLRDICDFPSVPALLQQIARDISEAQEILSASEKLSATLSPQ